MLDAEHPRSLCNDQYAKRFMDERGMQIFAPFRSETMPNISNIVRCYIIDEAIRSQLIAHPDSLIISIGAGFDTRPYRIKGGEWVEIDEPQIIEYKNEKLLIAECTNKLTRITISFSNQTLDDKLEAYRQHKNIIIVIEGVFMYLENDVIEVTINQLQTLFPKHILLCDLMKKKCSINLRRACMTSWWKQVQDLPLDQRTLLPFLLSVAMLKKLARPCSKRLLN